MERFKQSEPKAPQTAMKETENLQIARRSDSTRYDQRRSKHRRGMHWSWIRNEWKESAVDAVTPISI